MNSSSIMLPVTERWAQVGPKKKNWLINIPRGGICISAFVIASTGKSILLGLPHANKHWPEDGGEPLWRAREMEKKKSWMLPATHMLIGESPDDAAARIANEFTGLKGEPKFSMVQSHTRPANVWWKTMRHIVHWDLCFVYDLKIDRVPIRLKPWWKELRLFSREQIPSMNVGRGHLDILREGGYVR